MNTASICSQCGSSDLEQQQRLGSEILWMICRACRHVMCAEAPLKRGSREEEEEGFVGASPLTDLID